MRFKSADGAFCPVVGSIYPVSSKTLSKRFIEYASAISFKSSFNDAMSSAFVVICAALEATLCALVAAFVALVAAAVALPAAAVALLAAAVAFVVAVLAAVSAAVFADHAAGVQKGS